MINLSITDKADAIWYKACIFTNLNLLNELKRIPLDLPDCLVRDLVCPIHSAKMRVAQANLVKDERVKYCTETIVHFIGQSIATLAEERRLVSLYLTLQETLIQLAPQNIWCL